MKTIFNAVARELFGPGCRQAGRSLFVCLALFLGLRASGVRVAAAPSVLWLTAGVFTAGAMRQALCSRRSAAIAQGLLEWGFPLRGWKLEADLWHHPRKYAVPLVLLAAAALLGAQPALLPLLGLLQAAELAVLLCIALRAR